MRINENTRLVDGKHQYRFFAYIHRVDRAYYGLLEASCYADALRHLGSSCRIRAVWLPAPYYTDKERRDVIVKTFGVLKSSLRSADDEISARPIRITIPKPETRCL